MLGRASALPSLSGLAVLRPKLPEICVLVERLDASDLDAWDALEIPCPDAVFELGARIRRLELARRELGRRADGGLALFIERVGERAERGELLVDPADDELGAHSTDSSHKRIISIFRSSGLTIPATASSRARPERSVNVTRVLVVTPG